MATSMRYLIFYCGYDVLLMIPPRYMALSVGCICVPFANFTSGLPLGFVIMLDVLAPLFCYISHCIHLILFFVSNIGWRPLYHQIEGRCRQRINPPTLELAYGNRRVSVNKELSVS